MDFPPMRYASLFLLLLTALLFVPTISANDVWIEIQPILQNHCAHCHGDGDTTEGDVDLHRLSALSDLEAAPELIDKMIHVIDAGYMPPEDEGPLESETRELVVDRLRHSLANALSSRTPQRTPIRRMNRFQYNNAVQDLFELTVEVFPLPERMMREHGNYFKPANGIMPTQVRVGSRPLGKSQMIEPRLAGVTPFPQDLRAEHGFDNRGDHLSLSPLLLESFLKLSRSIVESEDFHVETCGTWNSFFAPPEVNAEGVEQIVRQRLRVFLRRAFRRPVDDSLLQRYVGYTTSQIEAGFSFTDAMKSTAAAILASPRFFYLYDRELSATDSTADFDLASRLSFFLWGSLPDDELLDLAEAGKLSEPRVLAQQVDRMLQDRRLKRFCDSFPTQWLQLERIISSTPDNELYPQFYFSKYRASMHMMLEPLLVFETLLIENGSIFQLVDADFSYRSDLLEAWYRDGSQGNVGPPTVVTFRRVPITDRRQGGVITNAAVMTMTSEASRTKPITRGAWIASVILHDAPQPPPADVPPLSEEPLQDERSLTLRERFASHRERADCAGCHQRIDPLGFALENYDAAGIWRDTYENGQPVDASGRLFGRHSFVDVVELKDALLAEKRHFATAFASHLLAFALGREVEIGDVPALDRIVQEAATDEYRFHTLIQAIVMSDPFLQRTPATGPTDSKPDTLDGGTP